MNLSKIIDKKENYLGLKDLSPNNLYFNLAQKGSTYINPANNRNKISTTWNLLGNQVRFYYGGDQVNIVVGGKRYTGHGSNLKALEEALYNLFQGELKGEVSLSRPDHRSMLSDRNDFNKAKGTCFPSLYKSVAWDKEGKKNSEVLGSRSNAIALTKRQFENASSIPSFKKSNFTLINREGTQFYLNKGAKFLDFNSTEFIYDFDAPPKDLTPEQFFSVLWNPEKNYGMWARTETLGQLSNNIDSYLNTACLYKGRVWLVIPSQTTYDVKPFI